MSLYVRWTEGLTPHVLRAVFHLNTVVSRCRSFLLILDKTLKVNGGGFRGLDVRYSSHRTNSVKALHLPLDSSAAATVLHWLFDPGDPHENTIFNSKFNYFEAFNK